MATTKQTRRNRSQVDAKAEAGKFGGRGEKSAAPVPDRRSSPARTRSGDAPSKHQAGSSSSTRAGSRAKRLDVKPPATSGASGTGPVSDSGTGATFRDGSKGGTIVSLLKLKDGATIGELTKATGWQAHSVRGFLSGALKKKAGLTIASEKGDDGERRYRIAS